MCCNLGRRATCPLPGEERIENFPTVLLDAWAAAHPLGLPTDQERWSSLPGGPYNHATLPLATVWAGHGTEEARAAIHAVLTLREEWTTLPESNGAMVVFVPRGQETMFDAALARAMPPGEETP